MNSSPETLQWTVHPASARPVRAALAVMFIAMIAGALYQATETYLYSTIAILVLLVSLVPFFMPTQYELNRKCIVIKQMGRIQSLKWSEIRTWDSGQKVVYLSPYTRKSLRQKRSILLLCPDNHREVVDYIEKVR